MEEIINIDWCDWSEIINEDFIPLIEDRSRYLILYGGRGSSKSNFTAKKLIYRCLNEKYFKCILIKQEYNTIKDSSYEELKKVVEDLGLEQYFTFKLQPLEIICNLNGNKFIARGMDKASKLKSIKDPSAVWYEEDIPKTFDEFITITAGVRTSKADYLQEIFTVNPECEGDYQDFWFYKYFFEGNEGQKSFKNEIDIAISKNISFKTSYSCHHHTYHNNKWVPDSFKAQMEDLKRSNPYRHGVYCLGEWGNKEVGGLFYKHFTRSLNTSEDVKYNPELPLHISFDFNVNPYMPCSIWQIDGRTAICIDEIASPHPKNTTKDVCYEIQRRYQNHSSGMFIYGDANGRKEDTRSEKGHNDFKVIDNELFKYRPTFRIQKMNPYVKMRGDFINTILQDNFNGIRIMVSSKCSHLITDFLFLKEDSNGGKLKEKTTKDGKSIEKYGHLGDSLDYFICEAFKTDYNYYQKGSTPTSYFFGKKEFNEARNY